MTADYLLGLTETKKYSNADLADLHMSDDMIDLLKSGRIDTALLCELAAHPDFLKLLADIQIYVARDEIVEKYQPGEHDKIAGVLQAAKMTITPLADKVNDSFYIRRRFHIEKNNEVFYLLVSDNICFRDFHAPNWTRFKKYCAHWIQPNTEYDF